MYIKIDDNRVPGLDSMINMGLKLAEQTRPVSVCKHLRVCPKEGISHVQTKKEKLVLHS